jgi:hypothetical protein
MARKRFLATKAQFRPSAEHIGGVLKYHSLAKRNFQEIRLRRMSRSPRAKLELARKYDIDATPCLLGLERIAAQ